MSVRMLHLLLLISCIPGCTHAQEQGWSRIPLAENMRTKVKITEAITYDNELPIHPSLSVHHAIDLACSQGTPVYFPFDEGWVLGSFHTYHISSTLGQIGYGLGNFAVMKDKKTGRFMVVAHMSQVEWENVAKIAAFLENGEWNPRGVYVSDADFENIAKPAKRGMKVGEVGCTGLGKAGIVETPEKPINPGQTWDPAGPHVHTEHFFGRTPSFGKKGLLDPFNLPGPEKERVASKYAKALVSPVLPGAALIGDPAHNNWPAFAK